MERLKSQALLDRVVIDKAHLILDAHDDFQPCLLTLPEAIAQFNVQTVLLTGTLLPFQEPMFLKRFGVLSPAQIITIRTPTRRPNIQYTVKLVSSRSKERIACIQETRRLYHKHKASKGKILAFGHSIADTEAMGKELV